MAAITQIVLNDGASTPVAHTFVPMTPQTGAIASTLTPALWYSKDADSVAGYQRLNASVGRNGNGMYKALVDLAIPRLASPSASCCTDTNVPSVTDEHLVNVRFTLPPTGTSQLRKNLRVELINYLQSAQAIALIDDLEPAW